MAIELDFCRYCLDREKIISINAVACINDEQEPLLVFNDTANGTLYHLGDDDRTNSAD